MTTANLLVELFVEELPPKALKKLGEAFAALLADGLKAQGLAAADAAVTPYASPRRLAVHVAGVRGQAPDSMLRIKLMPASVGLNPDGVPTAALRKKVAPLVMPAGSDVDGFIKACVTTENDGKAEQLILSRMSTGALLANALQTALDDAIAKLPIPKVMQYQLESGAGADFQPGWTSVHFVRPAHGLVALHGDDVVPVTALGLHAGRSTIGHRFEAKVPVIALRDADSYAAQLRDEGAVIAGFAERRAELVRQLQAAAAKEGLMPIEDEALLDEVTGLVERPNVLLCRFEPEFLAVPQECLILTMKANQKYFPLLDAHDKLAEKFLIVSNITPADSSRVIQGNERVVRPRLADAKFFFDQDRKRTLQSRVEGLAKVVYHGKLGSQGDRAERVRAIGHALVNQLRMATLPYTVDAQDEFAVLDSKVQQAALLAKTDLLTDMVGEFPELQGVMGGYYARHEGLRDGVAIAIEDHYKPRFAGDALPRNHSGTVLALADKLETLVGLFGIGQLPTGDKDPFALRRQALGVLRILVEKNLPLALPEMVAAAFGAFPAGMLGDATGATDKAHDALLHFVDDRLVGYLRDLGHSAQEVEAVTAIRTGGWGSLPKRLAAVRAFADLPEAASLAAANKRVGNILKKIEGAVPAAVDAALLQEPAEQALAQALAQVQPHADSLFEQHDYAASLQALAALKAPVDAFFDGVMVNTEDTALRANRQALLAGLHAAMNRVADLSRLAT
jgi:glycyl-tRNA synthetase beta chain